MPQARPVYRPRTLVGAPVAIDTAFLLRVFPRKRPATSCHINHKITLSTAETPQMADIPSKDVTGVCPRHRRLHHSCGCDRQSHWRHDKSHTADRQCQEHHLCGKSRAADATSSPSTETPVAWVSSLARQTRSPDGMPARSSETIARSTPVHC